MLVTRNRWPVVALSFILVGCPASPGVQTRAGQSLPPTIVLTDPPMEWTEIPRGGVILQGTVNSEAGLDPEAPCRVTVTDHTTGMTVTTAIASSDPDFPHTSITLPQGAFVIDAINDFRIAEGPKRIDLEFKDIEDNLVVWSVNVMSGPLLDDYSEQVASLERKRYAQEMMGVLSGYRAFIAGEAFDPVTFPERDFDLAFLTTLEDLYAQALLLHADYSQWNLLAQSFRTRLDEVYDLASLTDVSEREYRSYLKSGTDVFLSSMESKWEHGCSQQFWFRGDIPPTLAWDELKWESAFHLNTFIQVDYVNDTVLLAENASPTATTIPAELTAHIRTNTNTRGPSGWLDQPFIAPISDTYLTNPPVFTLQVRAEDTDLDGDSDTLTYEGQDEGAIFPHPADPDPMATDHFGHPMNPLFMLLLSEYWAPIS